MPFDFKALADNVYIQQIKPITDNPIIQLVVVICTILGFILLFIFYFRSKKEKRPSYAQESIVLVEGLTTALTGLKVLYNNEPQERITVTRLYFWNAGKETIRSEDISDVSPLHAEINTGTKVLSAKVMHMTDSACKFKLVDVVSEDEKPTLIRFGFAFLDFNDGGLIQIVHTGPGSQKLTLGGKIIGAKKIEKGRLPEPSISLSIGKGRTFGVNLEKFGLLVTFVIAVQSTYLTFSEKISWHTLVNVVYALVCYLIAFALGTQLMFSKVPKKLKQLEQNK